VHLALFLAFMRISIYSSSDDMHQRGAASKALQAVIFHSKALQAVLFYSSGILYYVSAVINPILYNIMSLKFRRAFRTTLCRSRCCRAGRRDADRDGRPGGSASRPRHRPVAYRFSAHGHGVQMLRVGDTAHLPARRGAAPASAPARFSADGTASRSSAAAAGHGSVDERSATAQLGVDAARRRSGQGQLRAASCPRADWRASSPASDDRRTRRTDHRHDAQNADCMTPASLHADRTSV